MADFPYPECDPGTVLKANKRYFGEFKCRSKDCARRWKSGNSWLGFGQNCTGCGRLIFPWKLSYLEASPTTRRDAKEIEKRHPKGECERCRTLGYYCRDSANINIQGKYSISIGTGDMNTNRRTSSSKSFPVSNTPKFVNYLSENSSTKYVEPTPIRKAVAQSTSTSTGNYNCSPHNCELRHAKIPKFKNNRTTRDCTIL